MKSASDRPLRLLVVDATGHGAAWVQPLLTASWRVGGALYGAAGRFDATLGARTWAEAFDWLATVDPGREIGEIQYWGHGLTGRVRIAEDVLDAGALTTEHAHRVAAVRARLLGPDALVWFRTCSAFGGRAGHRFARACADAFGCRTAGHTFVIGALQSGLHSLAPGASPAWPAEEGFPSGVANPTRSLGSGWGRPNTITCLRDTLPAGW